MDGCLNLEVLNVCWQQGVSDAAILRLAEKSPALQRLYLRGCGHISECALAQLAGGCKLLRKIEMPWSNPASQTPV